MLGGIIGDVIGSIYEGHQWQRKDLDLVSPTPVAEREDIKPMFEKLKWVRKDQAWTDDTLCTLGLYHAYLYNEDPTEALVRFCKAYNDEATGFGKAFAKWLDNPVPYNSLGNGSIMRVGFIPYLNEPLSVKLKIGHDYTAISHNHEDSFVAVESFITICDALQWSKQKGFEHKTILDEYLKLNNIDDTVESLHEQFVFELNAKKTLNQAVVILAESNSFEEALANCFYVGGDSDTLACVVGNMAGIVYDIPKDLLELSMNTLKPYPELDSLVNKFIEDNPI
jgi:ADP-ribosyl-[dinitrogen reductase] hydrolase